MKTQLRPYQRLISDRILSALYNPSMKHVGLIMPTGSGASHTIVAVLNALQHHRQLDVLVIGQHEMTQQLQDLVTNYINVVPIGLHVKQDGFGWSDVPKFWDIAIIFDDRKRQNWWYANKTITINSLEFQDHFDYGLELKCMSFDGSDTRVTLLETTKMKGK